MQVKEKNIPNIERREVVIPAPHFDVLRATIIGDTKFVVHKFSQKAREQIKRKQEMGSLAKKGQKREPKNFKELYEGALYVDAKNKWYGFSCSAVRNAMVSACKIVGFHMSKGKLSIFILPDGFDAETGTPLVKISKGEPHPHEAAVRLETGVCDICVRPMWDEGWEAVVNIRYDADMFSQTDIMNLLTRAGMQVGIGEGRPDSKDSCGCGWGTFTVDDGRGRRSAK